MVLRQRPPRNPLGNLYPAMNMDTSSPQPTLQRGLGFWQATAINITQIVGAGVFATVPLILGVMPGPQALLAWLVAGLLIICDSMIWGELGAAMPSAGGSYHYLLESFGRSKWGRLMSFLFVWQILISGPLEVGSGLVAAAQFSKAISPEFKAFDEANTIKLGTEVDGQFLGMILSPTRAFGLAMGVLILALLYRRVDSLGKISLFFLAAVMTVIAWVLLEGLPRFKIDTFMATSSNTPESPPWSAGLGAGMGLAIYSYFGYYNVCYLGGEVRNPARTLPRSILCSAFAVVILFSLVHLAFTGVIPLDEIANNKDNLTAEFMTRMRGDWAGKVVTVLLVGSCFASCFSGTLGYSRVPYAAAREGNFLRWFDSVHPTHQIPHRSLLLIGGLVLFWSLFSLDMIISALVATRIIEQFIAQIFAVILLRKQGGTIPWRMPLYPIPLLVALAGWLYVYAGTGLLFILLGLATLMVGLVVFLVWSATLGQWPFDKAEKAA